MAFLNITLLFFPSTCGVICFVLFRRFTLLAHAMETLPLSTPEKHNSCTLVTFFNHTSLQLSIFLILITCYPYRRGSHCFGPLAYKRVTKENTGVSIAVTGATKN